MRTIPFETHSYYSYQGTLKEPRITHRRETLDVFLCRENLFSYEIEKIGVVPPRHIINHVLKSGEARSYFWEGFEIDEAEYQELCQTLSDKSDGYCVQVPDLAGYKTYQSWWRALVDKIHNNPRFKPITNWSVQNDLIGIPIGPQQWIVRDSHIKHDEAVNVDRLLKPLNDFLRRLETACVADCCGMAAFDLYPENINERLSQDDKLKVIPLLESTIQTLQELPASHQYLKSERLNSTLTRAAMVQVFQHILDVISRG